MLCKYSRNFSKSLLEIVTTTVKYKRFMHQALIKISGQVQGVFYRAHARDEATNLNLKGYVKNMPNQTVEALVQGEKNNIEKFIEWCKEGSPSSKVEKVEIIWQTETEQSSTFLIQ